MREVVIHVSCDSCGGSIAEETEGSATVTLTIRGGQRVLDLCDECISGTFLQEARPVKTSKRKSSGIACSKCGKSYVRESSRDKHEEWCLG